MVGELYENEFQGELVKCLVLQHRILTRSVCCCCCVFCDSPFLPGTFLEPAVIPIPQASSFQTAERSVMCVTFQTQLSFVLNLLNVYYYYYYYYVLLRTCSMNTYNAFVRLVGCKLKCLQRCHICNC